MKYAVYKPHPALAAYVKCYWSLDHDAFAFPASRERVFPDGCIELIFHCGDLFKKYTDEDAAELQPRSFIHGQLKRFIDLEATGAIGIFSIRFHPHGLQAFLDFKVQDLTERSAGISDFWGADGTALEDRMLHAADHGARIRVIEKFLFQKLGRAKQLDGRIGHCVRAIIQTGGTISIDTLANGLCIGRRQLERKFVSGVGLNPKLFARIARFQHTLQLLEQRPAGSLTVIGYQGGFFDQAHFIKDFKEFTGLNPSQYFSRQPELAKLFAGE